MANEWTLMPVSPFRRGKFTWRHIFCRGRDEQAGQNATADDFSTFGQAGRAGAREDLQTYWFAAQTINGSTLRGLLHENFSNTRRGHRHLSGGMRQGSRPEG